MEVEGRLRGVRDSLVVADLSALDAVKMSGGLDFLWEDLSIASLVTLDDMVAGRKPHHVTTDKISFLVSGFLPEVEQKLMEVLLATSYSECNVFSGVSEDMLIRLGRCQEGYFASLTTRIKDWLRQGQTEAEAKSGATAKKIKIAKATVTHAPLLVSPLGESAFFIPSCADFFPAFPGEGISDYGHLPTISQRNVDIISQTLVEFLAAKKWHSHFFSFGPTSEIVAKRIVQINQQPQQPEHHASVLLVDRTLDLVAPCLHSDNLMDQMYATIPRKTAFSIDLSIDIHPLLDAAAVKGLEQQQQQQQQQQHKQVEVLFPDISGTLSTGGTTTEEFQKFQHALLAENSRGALNAVKKALVDIAAREKLSMKAPKGLGKVTVGQLCEMMESFSFATPSFEKHLPVLQLVSGVIQTLKNREAEKWDELMGVEKMLLATLIEGESVLQQLLELLQQSDGQLFSLNQVLTLAILVYSLMGPEFDAELASEPQFQEAVERALSKADGSEEVTLTAREKARHIFEKLRAVREARSGLKTYQSLVSREAESSYVSLVSRVVEDLFDEARPETSDIVQAQPPESVQQKSFLSGFSQYLSKGMKSRPDGRGVLVVFVVGGITCKEIKEILDIVSKNQNEKIVIGSTDIIAAKEIYNSVFL